MPLLIWTGYPVRRGGAASRVITLATCVRDAQEEQYVLSRLDRARLDKLLAEHDPFEPQI